MISKEIHLVFKERIDDHIFLRWNYSSNKPEVLVFPNGELQKEILKKQRWSSEELAPNDFDSWMTRQNIHTINVLLSANSIEELNDTLIKYVILENKLFIVNGSTEYGEKSPKEEMEKYILYQLKTPGDKVYPLKDLSRNTIFSNKVKFSGDMGIGMLHVFYFRFDSDKNKWR